MQKLAVLLLILTFTASAVRAAEVAPDWSLVAADGSVVRLSEVVEEQPVVLFFWATWCPYCKALMPHLQSIRLEYGDDVKILAINFRDDNDPVAYVRGTGYDFTVLADGDEVAKLYEVWGTPGVIVVDQQRQMQFDLRNLPGIMPPKSAKSGNHRAKAAFQAPYWAAEIRKGLDLVLQDQAK